MRFICQFIEFDFNFEGNRKSPSQQRMVLIIFHFPRDYTSYNIQINGWEKVRPAETDNEEAFTEVQARGPQGQWDGDERI